MFMESTLFYTSSSAKEEGFSFPELDSIKAKFKQLSRKLTGPTRSELTPKEITDYLYIKLFDKPRSGLIAYGVENPESILEHCQACAEMMRKILPLYGITDPKVIEHATKVMFYHDFAEALVHDITYTMGFTKEEKSKLEAAAIEFIKTHAEGGEDIARYWQEYEDNETFIAHICHGVDKLQHLDVILECECNRCSEYDMTEFWTTAEDYLKNSKHAAHYGPLRKLFDEKLKEREILQELYPEFFKDKKTLVRKPLSPRAKKGYIRNTLKRIAVLKANAAPQDALAQHSKEKQASRPEQKGTKGTFQACTAA